MIQGTQNPDIWPWLVAGGQSPGAASDDARGIGGATGVPDGGTSSASAMAEARAEFRHGDPRVDVGYWQESQLLCTERDRNGRQSR
jgi:hypothetical protein